MKIGDIVELIRDNYDNRYYNVGDFGIIKSKYVFAYTWKVEFFDFYTKKPIGTTWIKQEDLRLYDSIPTHKKIYTEEEKNELIKISEIVSKELRNFQEYDSIEIIRDRPNYAKENVFVGDRGIVLFNQETTNGEICVLISDYETCADKIDLVVRREDIRVVEKWCNVRPTYTEKQKQELIKWSDDMANLYKQKDDERHIKFGW